MLIAEDVAARDCAKTQTVDFGQVAGTSHPLFPSCYGMHKGGVELTVFLLGEISSGDAQEVQCANNILFHLSTRDDRIEEALFQ